MMSQRNRGDYIPLSEVVTHRSGNSALIKGKQHKAPGPGRYQAYSASGPDIWVDTPEHEGDGIIVSAVGARCGRTFLATGQWTAVANTHVLRPSESIDPRFLWYLTNDERFWIRSGTAQPFVKVKDTLARPVWLPPLLEQRRIVGLLEDYLSRIDAADKALEVNCKRLGAFTRSALHAVTELSAERAPLSEFVSGIEAGKSFGSSARPAGEDEWGIVKVSAMTWGEFRPEENKVVTESSRIDSRYEIHAGDLLVSRANTTEYVGAPVLVRQTRPRLLLSDKSLRLKLRPGWEPEFLLLLLSAPGARAQMSARATGTKDSMRNISQTALLSIEVPRIGQDQQHAVISRAHAYQQAATMQLESLRRSAARSSTLRRSLLTAALTGRLPGRPPLGPLEEADDV